ncbi:MAG: hypothetical protein VXA68_08435, partial [Gammaproteobacteria bacterium]
MSHSVGSDFSDALKDSAPVMFGYVPLGMAFGVLFQTRGYHWLFAALAGGWGGGGAGGCGGG